MVKRKLVHGFKSADSTALQTKQLQCNKIITAVSKHTFSTKRDFSFY